MHYPMASGRKKIIIHIISFIDLNTVKKQILILIFSNQNQRINMVLARTKEIYKNFLENQKTNKHEDLKHVSKQELNRSPDLTSCGLMPLPNVEDEARSKAQHKG